MKKYALVYLIKGDAEKYQRRVMHNFSNKFKVSDLNNHISPHITLKSPFESSFFQMFLLKQRIRKLSKKIKKSNIRIKGIGNFGFNVIYLGVIFSEEAKKARYNLIKSLEKLNWMSWREHDRYKNFHPHATLTYCDNKKQFLKFKKYFLKFKPNFNLYFDNITILRKNKSGNWQTYREIKLS